MTSRLEMVHTSPPSKGGKVKKINGFRVLSPKAVPRQLPSGSPSSPVSPLSPLSSPTRGCPGSPKLEPVVERPQHPCNPVDTTERRNALTKRPDALGEAPQEPEPMSRAGIAIRGFRQNTCDLSRECTTQTIPLRQTRQNTCDLSRECTTQTIPLRQTSSLLQSLPASAAAEEEASEGMPIPEVLQHSNGHDLTLQLPCKQISAYSTLSTHSTGPSEAVVQLGLKQPTGSSCSTPTKPDGGYSRPRNLQPLSPLSVTSSTPLTSGSPLSPLSPTSRERNAEEKARIAELRASGHKKLRNALEFCMAANRMAARLKTN
eukprot:Hpha_TRINITY_DN15590_c3_g3::TRINITY_DN15590_c3_g3_i1::g.106313::m.106313